MNQFRFRFKTVLRVRELNEKTKQKDFAAQQARLMEEQRKLKKIIKEQNRNKEALRISLTGTMNVEALINRNFFGFKLEDDEKKQTEAMGQEELELGKKRMELIKASREKRIIERLQEKDLKAYQQHLDRMETAFLDEVAAAGFIHKEKITPS